MKIDKMNSSLENTKIYQVWRFISLNLKIIKGVYHSKFLPDFKVKYKVSYEMEDEGYPDAIANTGKPPQVGSHVALGKNRFEIIEIGQMLQPKGEFCFLRARCRFVCRL